ncbi:MAG TPA: class I SAM-dependent methyltransferase [Pirellulales bacterium]|jgi:SAM-dependent methyltransferase|nr:class I SAM-dependent methyltransferase [Pirellulales bacterium]
MRAATYAAEAEVEEYHWWFAGRRKLFARIIKKMATPRDAAILDVGSSTGTNLRMLRDAGFTSFQGVDISPESQYFCNAKGLGPVELGSILDLPHPDSSFDLVLATDVIEHIDDDLAAIGELRRVLRPGGLALITVPAFECLWGPQDVVAEHKRRYRIHNLQDTIKRARLEIVERYYFNFILFLPILFARKALRLLSVPIRSENDLNFGLMNAVLRAVFEIDTRSAAAINPPFGVSILALCRKPSLPAAPTNPT